MRKNWTMRAGALMMMLTLMTTCFAGGTFAKYVTAGEGTDNARVAKFGVTVTANGETFKQAYDKDDETATTITGATVSSSTEDKLLAPGTGGDMASVALAGTPEVAVRVAYEGTFELGDNWMVDGTFYCPLEITVNDKILKGVDFTSAEDFETAVNGRINSYTKEFEANTDLSTVGASGLKVSWEWPFEVTGNDGKDTALGDAAAAGNAATASLTVKTTVTQID